MTGTSYDQFRNTRHLSPLDGVRALAILLVIASHMPEPWWQGLNGWAGVTLFFGLSGFLITTLALREEDDQDRLTLSGFYIRRAFRIFPVYYLILGVYAALIFGGALDGRPLFEQNLPYFLTYMNELTTEGHYRHTWSLGIEEKFYLVWPLVAFVLLAKVRRWRIPAAVLLLLAIVGLNHSGLIDYDIGLYAPILIGCLLALLLHEPALFTTAARFGKPPVILVAVTVAVVLHTLLDRIASIGLLYAATTVGVMGMSLVTTGWLTRFLGWPGWRYIAERSYSMYLVHALALRVASVPFGGHESELGILLALMRCVATVAVSVLMAAVLWHLVERPLIRVGKRFSDRTLRRHNHQPVPAPTA